MSGLRRRVLRGQVDPKCALCDSRIVADRYPSVYDERGVRLESFCDPVCLELKHTGFAARLPGVPA